MKQFEFTKEGFEKIEAELKDLLATKRAAAVERLHKARSMGDLSENSEYVAAKENLEFTEERIQELEAIIKSAVVVEHNHNGTVVEMGSQVTVEVGGQKEDFILVGEFETDPLEKKLSHTSPLGHALLLKKVGDVVQIEVPAGRLTYKILDIKNT